MLEIDEHENHEVPQVSTDPVVLESEPLPCQAGPCDGQRMRCPDGYVLIVTPAIDGLRATALPARWHGHDVVELARRFGGYIGHYARGEVGTLAWHPADV